MDKIKNLIKHSAVIQALYIFFGTAFFRIISIFVPIKKNLILFSSMSGDEFEYSSPYCLYLAITAKYGHSYEYVWAFSKKQDKNSYTGKRIRIDTFRYFIFVLKAKIWITDVNIERGLKLKRKKQYYVNTWHGGITKGYPKERNDYKLNNVNIFCSDGINYERFFTNYYGVNPASYIRCGRPREDDIFECEKNRNSIRKQLGFSKDDYVILYMPTWRENLNVSYLNLSALSKEIKDAKVIFHGHHLFKNVGYSIQGAIDYSNTKNLNMLYALADILISDYSSCIYDFLLLDKPVLLFAKDYDEYVLNRGLAIDLKKEFPFSISSTEKELIEKIDLIRRGYDKKAYQIFLSKVVSIDRRKSATAEIMKKMESDGAFCHEN